MSVRQSKAAGLVWPLALALPALAILLALACSDAVACSPNAPPVPRPGESDLDYRTRSWSERLAFPVYTNIFTARIAATIRDESDTRSQPPYHVVVHVADVRVHRGKEVVFEGDLDSLRRNRDDVKEVATGFECGIGCDRFSSWQEGDRIEAYKLVTQRRTLST